MDKPNKTILSLKCLLTRVGCINPSSPFEPPPLKSILVYPPLSSTILLWPCHSSNYNTYQSKVEMFKPSIFSHLIFCTNWKFTVTCHIRRKEIVFWVMVEYCAPFSWMFFSPSARLDLLQGPCTRNKGSDHLSHVRPGSRCLLWHFVLWLQFVYMILNAVKGNDLIWSQF